MNTQNQQGDGGTTLLDLPPAIHPGSTRKERMFAHKAKMVGKKYDRARRADQRTQITTRAELRRLVGVNSHPTINRHTGKPHECAREIMRRTMTPLQRRDFAAGVVAKLGIAA